MQAQTSPRQASSLLAWVIAGLGVILMLLLLVSFMADSRSQATSEVAGATSNRIAYLQFGRTADTLRLADPAAPADAKTLLTIPHAAEYGILPSISPDGKRFSYTALPQGLALPGPDSPAGLWVASIGGTPPHQLTKGVDLLVHPVWTSDSQSLVYRRSTATSSTLALMSAAGGEEHLVAYSEKEALFPVGFERGGGELLYVGLSKDEGSHLYKVDLASGVANQIATLSPGLTRDWALSPDGTRLAFLEVAFSETDLASRASVLDLASGDITPLTPADEYAFVPVWRGGGVLAVGTLKPANGEANLLIVNGDSRTKIAGPETGFDVPLAYSQSAGAYLVSSFENDSVTSPGRSTLMLVGADGRREKIAEGEVTLVGWTHP